MQLRIHVRHSQKRKEANERNNEASENEVIGRKQSKSKERPRILNTERKNKQKRNLYGFLFCFRYIDFYDRRFLNFVNISRVSSLIAS